MLGIHLTLFVHEQHRLHFARVKVDLAAKRVCIPTITLEQNH